MENNFRYQITRYVSANRSSVAGIVLFGIAFSIFAVNAVYNQPGAHPLPLLAAKTSATAPAAIPSDKSAIPVHKVETTRIPAFRVPIPTLRPHNTPRKSSSAAPRIKKSNVKKQTTGNFDRKLVTQVQVGLINYGNRTVTIDGVMDSQTKQAIEKFQQRFNLPVTGIPDAGLIRKLESVGALTRG